MVFGLALLLNDTLLVVALVLDLLVLSVVDSNILVGTEVGVVVAGLVVVAAAVVFTAVVVVVVVVFNVRVVVAVVGIVQFVRSRGFAPTVGKNIR